MIAFATLRKCWVRLWVAALLLAVSTALAHAAQALKWPNTQVQFDPATQRVMLTVPLEDAPRRLLSMLAQAISWSTRTMPANRTCR